MLDIHTWSTAETPEDEADAAEVKSGVVDLTESTAKTPVDQTDVAKVELEVGGLMYAVDVDLKHEDDRIGTWL